MRELVGLDICRFKLLTCFPEDHLSSTVLLTLNRCRCFVNQHPSSIMTLCAFLS